MIFAVRMYDAPNAPALRERHREAHFAYVAEIMSHLLVAGPVHGDGGPGSLAVLRVESRGELDQLMQADPYFREGVWERFEAWHYEPMVGDWVTVPGR